MTTGKAPISGGFVIVCAFWFVAMVVIAIVEGESLTAALSSLDVVAIALVTGRGLYKARPAAPKAHGAIRGASGTSPVVRS